MLVIYIYVFVSYCFAADPFVSFNFEVSYITVSPLGVPQQVWFSHSSDLSVFFCLFFHSHSHFLSLLSAKLFLWGCLVFIFEKRVSFGF